MRHPRALAWRTVAGVAVAGSTLAALRSARGIPVRSTPTLLSAGAAAGAAGLMVHQWLSARSWLYGRVFWHARTSERLISLTFDDGPCHPYTTRLLDVLDREGVRATFFMPGANVRREPDLAAEVAASHAVGNHTFNHPRLTWSPKNKCREEIRRGQEAIHEATGVLPSLFRTPHGWYGPQVISAAEELGLRCVGWSVMAWDWNRPAPRTIAHRILRGARPGSISLLHDGQDTTVHPLADRSRTLAAVPEIIGRLKDEDYRFVTVPELMAADDAFSKRP